MGKVNIAGQSERRLIVQEPQNLFSGIDFDEIRRWSKLLSPNPSPLERLAGAIFVGKQIERCLMSMFAAYFDASGAGQGQPCIVVAGFLANIHQWQVFEKAWKNAHDLAGLDLPLHMAELVAACETPERYAKQKNARQDYVKIAQDLNRRDEFLYNLMLVKIMSIHCGMSCMVPLDIYGKVHPRVIEVVPPYALAARMCIAHIKFWEDTFGKEGVEYVFEAGDLGQGEFTNLMVDEGQAIPIYKNKKDFAGLQAADMYAWEQFFQYKGELRGATSEFRDTFAGLIWGIPGMHSEVTLDILKKVCHLKGINTETGEQNV
jgi:hypothetical protein